MRVTRLCYLASALLLGGSAAAQLPVEAHANQLELLESADPGLAAHKRLVFDFWRTVNEAHQVEHAGDYLAPEYVEHDPSAPVDLATLVQRLGTTPARPVADTIGELVSIVAERDLVVLAFRRELFDLANEGQTYTTTWFEMFRVADGKIVERWNFGPRD
jgi:predicted SnoaL-like aldol condensation-catalyzing enzyme